MVVAAIFVIFPFCMVFAALTDMLSMTIQNRVSLVLIAAFLALAPLAGLDLQTIGWHLAAFAAVLAVTFTLFAIGGMGGGDAKLLASTALWMGFGPQLMDYLLISTVLGGLLTLAILAYRKSALSIFTGSNIFLRNFANTKEGIPYGIALGIGGLLVYPETALVQWAIAQFNAV